MPQRGVENPSFTVHLAPRHGKIVVGAMDARVVLVVQLAGVQAEQHVYLVARPAFGLIDFVVFHERLGKMANSGEVRVFIDNGRVEGHPGMLVEPAADHLAVLRPVVVCVQSRVDAHKALAVVLDERHEILLLAVVHVQFAGRAGEDDGVEISQIFGIPLQILLGQQLGVGAQHGVPKAALLAHVVNSCHGGGH